MGRWGPHGRILIFLVFNLHILCPFLVSQSMYLILVLVCGKCNDLSAGIWVLHSSVNPGGELVTLLTSSYLVFLLNGRPLSSLPL